MIVQLAWPLPAQPYIPGRSDRPENGLISYLAETAPQLTDPEKWMENEAYLAGLWLYTHGYFWEAHEVWEPVWQNARPNSPERILLQALIQTANAGLKIAMERSEAARKLAFIASDLLHEAVLSGRDRVMGVNLHAASSLAEAFALALEVDPLAVEIHDCPDYAAIVHYNAEFFVARD